MAERSVFIVNRAGLHARPAAEFVKIASRFHAEIQLTRGGLEVNGKSIMGVLMLAAERGSEIVIRASGADALDAVGVLAAFVERGFEEE
jgi:phosphocarrier protein